MFVEHMQDLGSVSCKMFSYEFCVINLLDFYSGSS
jgi:hypothetical protein